MNTLVGVALLVDGSVAGLITQFWLWRRIPAPAAFALLAAAGIALGTGGLLVQDRAGPGDWALTLLVLGALTPLHGRLVFGSPGRSG